MGFEPIPRLQYANAGVPMRYRYATNKCSLGIYLEHLLLLITKHLLVMEPVRHLTCSMFLSPLHMLFQNFQSAFHVHFNQNRSISFASGTGRNRTADNAGFQPTALPAELPHHFVMLILFASASTNTSY